MKGLESSNGEIQESLVCTHCYCNRTPNHRHPIGTRRASDLGALKMASRKPRRTLDAEHRLKERSAPLLGVGRPPVREEPVPGTTLLPDAYAARIRGVPDAEGAG